MTEDFHSQDSDTMPVVGELFSTADAGGNTRSLKEQMSQIAGPEARLSYRFLKRTFDIVFVLLISPILFPIVLAIALAVRSNSPGPIFFSHRRIRTHGKFFSMWKFRTMCVNSQEVLEKHFVAHPAARDEWRKAHKLKNDPRVFPIGNLLRKTSLDELPQFWNVLTGSMSLVGPRPIVAAEVEKYGDYFNDYCLVKPGITGLWQVSGRSQTSYPERVQLDRQYAHNWSFLGDMKILARTLTSVFNRDGAY